MDLNFLTQVVIEMLYGGLPSKAQGQNHAKAGPEEDSGLVMPLSIPLIAGPGAIVTTATLSSSRTSSRPDARRGRNRGAFAGSRSVRLA